MLLNNIDHAVSYETGSVMKSAYEYIVNNLDEIKKLEVGRHELSNIHEKAFVNIMEYDTKDNPPWESHLKYIDIQIVFEGSEDFEVGDIDMLEKKGEYDSMKDYQDWTGAGHIFLTLYPNNMLVLYPKDAHRVGLHPKSGQKHVKKGIVKIPIL